VYFQLRKLILWPRKDAPPRIVDFAPGIVNVISGASKTGKSAVIPIIDYCLCSDKCAIPVGVIRESCSWFGIVVDTVEGQKLLARREPGNQRDTGDMFLLEAPEIAVPTRIAEKTTNIDVVKSMLNRLAGLTALGFEPGTESGFKSRPGFRDLMAFTFQPQNIVANPDTLFFKADTTEHREKLKTIFPYVLGAVTAEVLQARFELDRLNRTLRRKEAELREIVNASSAWRLEAQSWLRQAIELGLLPADELIAEDWAAILERLRSISAKGSATASPSLAGIDVTLARLESLRGKESEIASRLTEHRNRLNELRRLLESSEAYGGAMRVQRERLGLADWLRNILGDNADGVEDPLAALGMGQRDRLTALCDALAAVEVRLRSHPSFSDTLEKEVLRQRAAAEAVLEQLNEVRREAAALERDSSSAQVAANRFDHTERFIGRLDQALRLYDQADQSSDLRESISALRSQVDDLLRVVSDAEIHRKLRNALDRVESIAGRYIPLLDAEWPDAPLRLIVEELTVKVLRGNRDDYLREIGSGANWLAYHIAMTLALQRFFLTEPHHPVPAMLIFDQPSQVYFPRRLARPEESEIVQWRDQDVVAVRKVFSLLGEEVRTAKGRLQVIVLDHADDDVWGGLSDVQLTEEWRGSALVPSEWL
jgi:flagellar biosynthesis chaperone FliJ